jgi:uncharacterized protein involved in response to NO
MAIASTVQRSLPLHGEIPEPASRPRLALALAANGFRPFFLLAAAFASLIIPIWILVVMGVLPSSVYLDPATWHAHEMVFGFAAAVIAGFLLTAVANWTQRETLVGAPLLALAAMWVLGRVAMILASALPRGLPALVDLAFLPALIIALARPLIAAKSRRNFVMLAVVGALFAANVVVHLDALHVIAIGSGRRACSIGIDVVLLVILIIAGRVFPMFTRNATGVTSIRSNPVLDAFTIAGMATLTVADVFVPESAGVGAGAGIVGVLALVRAAHWGMRHTARQPLLWILHAGYGWVPVGLLLRALAHVTSTVSGSLATHALTVGAIGSLTLGMMARVALGHTGRSLVASKPIAAAFVAITAAAFARAIVPLFAPNLYSVGLLVAACLWTVAFLLYLMVYIPILAAPRVDGQPG